LNFGGEIFINFIFLVEWVDSVVMKACMPSRTRTLPNEDFVLLEKYIKEFSASYVYTHPVSSKETLTEKVRESMTANVKTSAYKSLLKKFGKHEGQFGNDDQQILNFAKDDIFKHSSTKKPSILNKLLATYMDSVGQIACGDIRGTCFLVTDMLVITNHHVCTMINAEREKNKGHKLPITVSFDYLRLGKGDLVVTVEVDEERDPQLENSHLDYKFLSLKESESLRNRVRLGPIVRNRSIHEGRIIIVGYTVNEVMHDETCVVVSNFTWRDKLKQRHAHCAGVHMTRLQINTKRYEKCLPYDTTLFSGSSGSPVFDMNGNIVAMHTQGYYLEGERGKCSLMEFGVQFKAIYEDMRRRYHVVEQFFPNCNSDTGEEQLDLNPNYNLDIDEDRMDMS
jgi:V8-like Glu-specific endopeptidase